ncbi:MAG: hypothetical protein M1813_000219 [Trichoglossum hirsutum]|nr:MAG: hypothetical protein M1813_000219 [Trichoglossum hirsutum]
MAWKEGARCGGQGGQGSQGRPGKPGKQEVDHDRSRTALALGFREAIHQLALQTPPSSYAQEAAGLRLHRGGAFLPLALSPACTGTPEGGVF